MSLPHILTEIGTYFKELQIPNFCLGPEMTVNLQRLGSPVDFNVSALPNCPLVLIVVWFTQGDFVVGQNFIVINKIRRELERINPLPNYFGSLSANSLLDAGFGGFKFLSLQPQDLPHALRSNYFSMIYYLQTRLINPQFNRDDLLQVLETVPSDMIIRYRDQILSFIPSTDLDINRGLILCAGQSALQSLPAFIPQGVNWTTVDTNLNSVPDIIGSYSSFETLKNLGLFNWDHVYVRGCPIGLSPTEYQNIIRAGRWLLKRGGRLYISNYYLGLVVLSERAQRERERESQTQNERIRQEEFFSLTQFDNRRIIFTA